MEEEFASYSGMNEQEIIKRDYKEYEKSGVKFGISAVLALTPEKREALAERLDNWAKDNYETFNVNMLFILVNDLETMTYSVISYGQGAEEVSLQVFGNAGKGEKFITVHHIPRKRLIAPIEKAIQDWLNSQLKEAA